MARRRSRANAKVSINSSRMRAWASQITDFNHAMAAGTIREQIPNADKIILLHRMLQLEKEPATTEAEKEVIALMALSLRIKLRL